MTSNTQKNTLDYKQILEELKSDLAEQHLVPGSLEEALFYEHSIFLSLERIFANYSVIVNIEYDKIAGESKQILNNGHSDGLLEIQQRLRNVNDVRTKMEYDCLDYMDTVLGRGASMLAATKNNAEIVPQLKAVFEKSRVELTSIIERTTVRFFRIIDNFATLGEKVRADWHVVDTATYQALAEMAILEARGVLSDELLLGSSEMSSMRDNIETIVPELKF